MSRALDVVVFGATGFTGRLVSEYLRAHGGKTRWAIAGRNHDKLKALGFEVPIIVGDALDRAAMIRIAEQTKVVCTTAGPFAKYGEQLVAACAESGTHYCDLTGEVQFMRAMIDGYHQRAKTSGARIVHTCGFDSIPSDMGVYCLQQEFTKRFGAPATTVTALYGETSGGVSGGTVASMLNMAEEMTHDKAMRRLMANPYALDPHPAAEHHADSPDDKSIGWNKELKMFTAPFVMAAVNTRVVRRSHALAGFPYGEDFRYREVMSTPGSPRGLAMAVGATAFMGTALLAMGVPKLREMIGKRIPPGDGPSAEKRAKGHWKVRLVGERGADRLVYIAADPDGDPGYQSTARMLGESALCLAHDPLTSAGGVLTPSTAMGEHLAKRLRAAGITLAPQ